MAAGRAALLAPAAVRLIDLDAPVENVCLPSAKGGRAYRSLLAIARLGGEPLGAINFVVSGNEVPRPVLELGLRRALNGRVNGGLADHPPRLASPTTSVSVVVTTCCEPVKLERCLRSLLACDYEHFEIIVVENRPGSGSTRRMLAKSFGAVREMRYAEESRPGLSRARNKGVMVARGELVAFIDDDTVRRPQLDAVLCGAIRARRCRLRHGPHPASRARDRPSTPARAIRRVWQGLPAPHLSPPGAAQRRPRLSVHARRDWLGGQHDPPPSRRPRAGRIRSGARRRDSRGRRRGPRSLSEAHPPRARHRLRTECHRMAPPSRRSQAASHARCTATALGWERPWPSS